MEVLISQCNCTLNINLTSIGLLKDVGPLKAVWHSFLIDIAKRNTYIIICDY